MKIAIIVFAFIVGICCQWIADAQTKTQTQSRPRQQQKSKTAKTKALEAGAQLLQNAEPIKQINVHVDGFHFVSGKMDHQMEAHHFCSKLSEEFTQCVLYDANKQGAHLIGVEYIVSRKIFESLDAEEKKLWHSHIYEVKSGQLVAPGIPNPAEHELMEQLIDTYGKTWHTWMASGSVPTGVPALMMGFTADGQIKPELLSRRDGAMKISSAEKKKKREDIPEPQIAAGADAWQNGQAVQLNVGAVKQ